MTPRRATLYNNERLVLLSLLLYAYHTGKIRLKRFVIFKILYYIIILPTFGRTTIRPSPRLHIEIFYRRYSIAMYARHTHIIHTHSPGNIILLLLLNRCRRTVYNIRVVGKNPFLIRYNHFSNVL